MLEMSENFYWQRFLPIQNNNIIMHTHAQDTHCTSFPPTPTSLPSSQSSRSQLRTNLWSLLALFGPLLPSAPWSRGRFRIRSAGWWQVLSLSLSPSLFLSILYCIPKDLATCSSNGLGCILLILLILPRTTGVPYSSWPRTGYLASDTLSLHRLHLRGWGIKREGERGRDREDRWEAVVQLEGRETTLNCKPYSTCTL